MAVDIPALIADTDTKARSGDADTLREIAEDELGEVLWAVWRNAVDWFGADDEDEGDFEAVGIAVDQWLDALRTELGVARV